MDITVGTNSWISWEDANLYMEGRYPSNAWDNAEDDNRKKALVTAWRMLNAIDNYAFASTPSEQMENAQCEQAYFLLAFGDDMERRDALLQAGVGSMSLGKFSESFKDAKGEDAKSTISPRALDLLKGYGTPGTSIVFGDLERDDSIE